MKLRSSLVLLIFCLCAITVNADSVKDELNQQYKKKVIAIRSALTPGVQRFDSNGQSLNPPPTGAWRLYGGIYVEKVSLSSKALRFQGRRIGVGVDKQGRRALVSMEKSVKVNISLDHPLTSVNEAQAILGKVFLKSDNIEDAQPELRRADVDIATEQIFHAMKDNVKAPRATYTPEPQFSEAARRARFQGIVILMIRVDKTGKISRVKLKRALGYGLDQNAMDILKTWRFEPATLNDEPVPVEMTVEVAFNLY